MKSALQRVWLDGRLYLANRVIAGFPSHIVRLWFYRHVMKAEIGRGSSIFMDAWLDTPGGLKIGEGSTINQRCRLDTRGGLTIGNRVSISAEVCILTAAHDIRSRGFEGTVAGVHIGDHVFIGTRAMILPGVTLGQGAVVAAGAVVTGNVEPYTIVAGVPARKLGVRRSDLDYTAHYRRLFH
jgi:maltose O-acetyltransferase